MKKSLLLFLVSVFIGGVASAQIDNTLQFVDKAGNVVADGATVEGELEYVDGGSPEWSYWQVTTGLSVRNNSSEEVGARCALNIISMDNGSVSCCFPGNCGGFEAVGEHFTDPNIVLPAELKLFNTEWMPIEYGQCTATFKIQIMNIVRDAYGIPMNYTFKADGPSVTVNFNYSDPAGIDGVKVEGENEIVARYTLDGRRLPAPKKGINIVKYANGKTAKIIVD